MTGPGAHHVQASIRPHLLDDVVEALDDVGITELVAAEAFGFSGRARRSVYRGVPYLALDDRVVVDIVTDHHAVDLVVDLVAANAWTGHAGDGTVWASRLERCVDIGTWAGRPKVLGR